MLYFPTGTYTIHFRRDTHTREDYTPQVKGKIFHNLQEASDARIVSGDLVVDAITHKIIKDDSWLWDWERKNPNCYAQRAIRADNNL